MPSIVNSDNGAVSGSAGLKYSSDGSGVLALQTNGTTAVTISTGQVATFAQAPVLPAASIPQAALAAGVAGNGPAFSAYAGSSQSIAANGTAVKVSINTEEFDTASAFDSTTNYRFQPLVAGYYQINGCVTLQNAVSTRNFGSAIFKNGSAFKQGTTVPIFGSDYAGSNVSAVIYMNGSTDYVELFCFNNHSSAINTVVSGVSYCFFGGSLVRSA